MKISMLSGLDIISNDQFAIHGMVKFLLENGLYRNYSPDIKNVNCCIIISTSKNLIDSYCFLSMQMRFLALYDFLLFIGTPASTSLMKGIMQEKTFYLSVYDELDSFLHNFNIFFSHFIHARRKRSHKVKNTLTVMQGKVVRYISTGVSMQKISELLGVNVKTISSHKISAMRKMHSMNNVVFLLKCKLFRKID